MKRTRKYAAALVIAAAGSMFLANLPAHAGEIELDKVDIVFRRNHDDAGGYNYPDRGPEMPPPPPQHGPRHMPPPQYAGDRHNFGPGGPRGHMPPPPHHGPRHMPPPHHHGW